MHGNKTLFTLDVMTKFSLHMLNTLADPFESFFFLNYFAEKFYDTSIHR